MKKEIEIGGRRIELSNQGKVFFPDAGVTKGDVVEYYRRIADVMLPHLRGRPVTMHRFPDGLGGEDWYHKDIPDYFPDWVDREEVPKEGGTVTHVVCNDAATLVYLANQACLTPHVWLSRRGHLEKPDRLIFDLDPSNGGLARTRFAVRAVRDALRERGLRPFLMTTGSRGFHVVVPLVPEKGFDAVRSFAAELAGGLAERHPQRLTVAKRKAKRGDRVFLDYLRNAWAQTAVAPYSLRARPGAPVAAPVDWGELDGLDPQRYRIGNIFRRLAQKKDPWEGISEHAQTLGSG